MKVLQVIPSLGYGGAETLVVNLLPHLKRRGIEVAVVSMTACTPLESQLQTKQTPCFTLDHQGAIYSLIGMYRSLTRLKGILRRERPDILHSHIYPADILCRFAAPQSCHLVTTLHGTDPWWYERTRIRSLLKTRLDRITGEVRNIRFVSVSEDVRKKSCDALAIPIERNRVIHNGIDLERFAMREISRKDGRTIVQVGRFYPEKGHATSLKALRVILEVFPDVRLLLIGNGPRRQELQKEVARLGLAQAVLFLGLRQDVPQLLRTADIFWMPSEREGLPIACLEAMASGLPVIGTAVGGLLEVVVDGETGFLTEKGSAKALAERTIQLLRDSDLAAKFAANGRKRVEKLFSVEATADLYVDAYKDVLNGQWK